MMPSTSVQIHSSAASRAAARMEAEKSEPPRPSVVGRPSAVAPLKPVITGRRRARAGAAGARGFFAGRLHQRRGVAEDGVGDYHLPGVDGGGGRAFGVQVLGDQQGGEPLAHGYGFIHRARRAFVEHGHAADDALEFADQRGDLGQHRRLAVSGSSSRQASSWRERRAARLASMPALVAGFGVAHGVEQQVGDLGHGRNHHRDRALRASSAASGAAARMRSAEPTLVPPNFMTSRSFN